MNLKSLATSVLIGVSTLFPMSAEAAHTQTDCFVNSRGGKTCTEIIYNSNGTIYVKTVSWNEYTEVGDKGFMNCSTGYIVGDATTARRKEQMKEFLRGLCKLAEDAQRNR